MKCPTCNCHEVFTTKKNGQANLCVDCRKGTNGHKKMAKPKPKNDSN